MRAPTPMRTPSSTPSQGRPPCRPAKRPLLTEGPTGCSSPRREAPSAAELRVNTGFGAASPLTGPIPNLLARQYRKGALTPSAPKEPWHRQGHRHGGAKVPKVRRANCRVAGDCGEKVGGTTRACGPVQPLTPSMSKVQQPRHCARTRQGAVASPELTPCPATGDRLDGQVVMPEHGTTDHPWTRRRCSLERSRLRGQSRRAVSLGRVR